MKRERVAVASGAVFCAAAFLLGTVLAGEAPVKLTDALSLGQAIQADNVTAWPLFSNQPVEKLTEYVTLAEAQDKKQAEVREVGARQPQQGGNAPAAQQEAANQAQPSAENRQQAQGGQQMSGGGATVNTLVIENKGALPILVLAGTLLKGGQQDRQIAQDFIVAPSQTVPVDAFCVEHGRWTASRDGVNTGGQFVAQKALTVQGVRFAAQHESSQSRVWENVAVANAAAAKNPGTGTLMATVEETDKEALARRGKISTVLTGAFKELANQDPAPLGLAYAVDGTVREVRAFQHPRIFQRYTEQLVNTAAMEGDLAQRKALAAKQEIYDKTADAALVAKMIEQVEKQKEVEVQTQAGNAILYKRGKNFSGGKTYDAADKAKAAPASQSWSASQ